jgi:sec-independent protein translocase protein TatA
MNIFGVGPMEMGIIAVAALLIFGPGKLPEVMGQAGKAVRDFRRMTAELTGEFEKTIAEAKDIGQSVSSEVGAMKSEVASVTESVKRDLGGTKGAKGKSGMSATTAGKVGKTDTTAGASAKKKTETTKKAAANGRKPAASTPVPTPKTHPKTGSAVADPIVVASKDDPWSDLSLFAAEPPRRERRVRRAVPAAVAVTNGSADASSGDATVGPSAAPARPRANGQPTQPTGDDALSRARQRRLAAGYGRRSA